MVPQKIKTIRITPEPVREIGQKQVFVYDPNSSDKRLLRIIEMLNGMDVEQSNIDGVTGQTYAIGIQYLNIKEIGQRISKFVDVAKVHADVRFFVFELGNQSTEHTQTELALLFKDVAWVENISLPQSYWQILASANKQVVTTGKDYNNQPIALHIGDVFELMGNGKPFRLFSAFSHADCPRRIEKLWENISSDMKTKGFDCKNKALLCFISPNGNHAITMQEITEFTYLISLTFSGSIAWGMASTSSNMVGIQLIVGHKE